MGLKVTNNAYGTLNASITSSSTTIVLVAGQGARFPTLSAGDYFYATLIDTSNNLEIVKVTARSTDTLTVVRGQDSTTARAYATNDRFELRPTAVMFTETITAAEGALPKAGGVMASGGRIQFQNSDGHTLYGIRGTRYGYSSSYRSLQIGNGANSENIALNVDVSAIAGGAFTGNGKDIVVPNSTQFWTPNSGNTDFILPMAFDSAGRVTMPLQPAFQAALNGNVTNSSSPTRLTTWVKVTNSIINNRDSGFSTANGRFTAPVAGLYLMGLHFDLSGGVTTGWYASVGINGSSRNYDLIEDTTLASNGGFYVTRLIPMQAGDYAEVYMLGGTWTLNGGTNQYNTRWEGFFIS